MIKAVHAFDYHTFAGCSLVASALHFCRVWRTLLGNNLEFTLVVNFLWSQSATYFFGRGSHVVALLYSVGPNARLGVIARKLMHF